MTVYSYSQFKDFAACPRRWQLSKKYDPRAKAKALAEGELMHIVLAKMYGTRDYDAAVAPIEVYAEEMRASGRDDWRELEYKFQLLRAMARAYWIRVAQNDLRMFDVTLAIEEPFEIPLSRGLKLVGVVDGVWRHRPSGIVFLVEHKYRADHFEELMPLDLQVSLYTLAMLPRFGFIPTLYNVVRKPVLKPEQGEAPAAYFVRASAMVDKKLSGFGWGAQEMDGRFFVRQAYTRSRRELAVALEQVRHMADRMNEIKKHPERVWRNPGDQCRFSCPFRDICIDDDDPLLIAGRFVKRVSAQVQEQKTPMAI